MELLPELADAVVTHDPQAQAARIVGSLVAYGRVRGAAVLRALPGAGYPDLFCSIDVTLDALAAAQSAFNRSRDQLRAGGTVEDQEWLLLPLLDGAELLGALYVRERHVPVRALDPHCVLLARTVSALFRPVNANESLSKLLSTTRDQDLQRRHLIEVLASCEGNIARAARALGVTRRTVYLRLQKFGIRADKPGKGIRRFAAV